MTSGKGKGGKKQAKDASTGGTEPHPSSLL
jgi:hypothetical protein